MRYALAQTIYRLSNRDDRIVFLTGDLGFTVFEKLQKNLKKRFINAGVAEHNMATLASGLAYAGFKPWIYSIAPFVSIKVLEEIRNDICVTSSNVKIIGLGGGYDYGIAGPTHHALEDVGILRTLPNMKVYAPSIASDVESIIQIMYKENGPAYLRLTKAENLDFVIPPYAPCRHIVKGNKITVIVLGSMIGKVMSAYTQLSNKYKKAVDIWTISELPISLPTQLNRSIGKTRTVCVIEEHVASGGLGEYISSWCLHHKLSVKLFQHLYAHPERSKKYGDRDFYLTQTGLDENAIINAIKALYGKQ